MTKEGLSRVKPGLGFGGVQTWWPDSLIEFADSGSWESESKKSWNQERDPETREKWEPIKSGRKGKILRDSGTMMDTAKILPKAKVGLEVTTEAEYGVYHQHGTGNMPARPWVGLTEKSFDKLADIALKNILKGI